MEYIYDIIGWLIVFGAFCVGLLLIFGAVRKEPPFAPGTEPKHYWDMTREEREAQQADIARRRDEALEKDAKSD